MKKKLSVFCSAVAVVALLVTVLGIKMPQADVRYDVSYGSVDQCYDDADDMNTTIKNEPTTEIETTVGTTYFPEFTTEGIADFIGGIGDGSLTSNAHSLDDINGIVENFGDSIGGIGEAVGGISGGISGGNSSGSLADISDAVGDIGGSSSDGQSSGFFGNIGGVGGIFSDAGDVFGSVFGGGSNTQQTQNANTTTVFDSNNIVYIDPVPAATAEQTMATTIVSVPSTQSVPSTVTTMPSIDFVDPAAKTNPYAKPTGEIKPGDMGDGVKWVQWNIIYSGYGLKDKAITGVYDDKTVEVVKKLQSEKGLTADGIVNDATIDKIELLYFEFITNSQNGTASTTAVDPSSTQTIGASDNESNPAVIIVAVILIVLVWAIAIIVIIVILVSKKKKAKKEKEASKDGTEGEAKNNDMVLADLFEEANSKEK